MNLRLRGVVAAGAVAAVLSVAADSVSEPTSLLLLIVATLLPIAVRKRYAPVPKRDVMPAAVT